MIMIMIHSTPAELHLHCIELHSPGERSQTSVAVQCSVVRFGAVQCSAAQCSAVQCGAVQLQAV